MTASIPGNIAVVTGEAGLGQVTISYPFEIELIDPEDMDFVEGVE